tara:strand:+ start:10471 stop:11298 length:828 start_codon:yes stop_codon:yes gene_type:complete
MDGKSEMNFIKKPEIIAKNDMKKGDFSRLAGDYVKYRPSYNANVTRTIVQSTNLESRDIVAADIGAGTGIFTKCLIDQGVKNLVAVEPNKEMRSMGQKELGEGTLFLSGSAEKTGLKSNHYDLITMASSFHWPDTKKALNEFNRLLVPGGVFAALWNPRLTHESEAEKRIQKTLIEKYKLKSRVSSGLSGITERLRNLLLESGFFQSVLYVDSIDIVSRTHEEYLGAWKSVNDVQAELGHENFCNFLDDVEKIIGEYSSVDVHYMTRAWIAFGHK